MLAASLVLINDIFDAYMKLMYRLETLGYYWLAVQQARFIDPVKVI